MKRAELTERLDSVEIFNGRGERVPVSSGSYVMIRDPDHSLKGSDWFAEDMMIGASKQILGGAGPHEVKWIGHWNFGRDVAYLRIGDDGKTAGVPAEYLIACD